MLTINNIAKTYDNGVKALNAVNLKIENGLYGLLGPNGAGKSSLMRTIATLQQPDQGSIQFGDIDVLNQPNELRQRLGLLCHKTSGYTRALAHLTCSTTWRF